LRTPPQSPKSSRNRFAWLAPFAALITAASHTEAADDWPAWRGPHGTGVAAEGSSPPIKWSETENIAWKAAVPGLGHSSPIVSGNRLFLTSAIPFGDKTEPPVRDNAPGSHDNSPVAQRHRFVTLCLDRTTGKTLWQTTCHEAFPHEGGHVSGSLASASPVTDGEVLIAFFGSHGLFGLDPKSGEIIWQKQLGKMATKHAHGEGASPALLGDTVV
jgi:outer membrane protein assembly factor BamB